MSAEQQAAKFQRIGVIGGGAWGTALAQSARRAGRDVTLWAFERETVEEINTRHTNAVFLPGVALDPAIGATQSLAELAQADAILMVSPSKFARAAAADLAPHLAPGKPVVICAKGFEEQGGLLLSEVLASVLPATPLAVLSGPSFAGEVARDLPVAVTVASEDRELGEALMHSLAHRNFRVYWTDDVRAVQIGGAVKNVLAIAAGIVEGRGYGASAHAALTARGFAELARFGTALGGRFETLTGLSGLGDLILTAHSTQSRNMSLGHALGQGQKLEDILSARKAFTEGVHTAGAVVAVARKHGVEMPICEAVNAVVKGAMSVDEAVHALLSRPLRPESDFLHFTAAPVSNS